VSLSGPGLSGPFGDGRGTGTGADVRADVRDPDPSRDDFYKGAVAGSKGRGLLDSCFLLGEHPKQTVDRHV